MSNYIISVFFNLFLRSYINQPFVTSRLQNPFYSGEKNDDNSQSTTIIDGSYACWPCLSAQALVSKLIVNLIQLLRESS